MRVGDEPVEDGGRGPAGQLGDGLKPAVKPARARLFVHLPRTGAPEIGVPEVHVP